MAEIEVGLELAQDLVRRVAPDLGLIAFEQFGNGWDNTAYVIDHKTVFRFPRRANVAHLLEREAIFLPRIAQLIGLAISSPTLIGAPTDNFPWSYSGYPLVLGQTGCHVRWSDEERGRMAEPLGRFLRELHGINPTPFLEAGLPHDELGRLEHAKRYPRTRDRYTVLHDIGVVGDEGVALMDWMSGNPPVAPPPDSLRIVHGDLYARHVVVSEAVPVGVIDWGDIHVGDSALDISIAHLALPREAYDAFRRAYGDIDERTWTAARYRAIYHAFLEIEYGNSVADEDMRRAGLEALRLICAGL
jgi:aminoglycoside phosphotransferase (APT) family kinase protein